MAILPKTVPANFTAPAPRATVVAKPVVPTKVATPIPPQQRFATASEVFPDGNIEALKTGDDFTIALFHGVSLAARVTGIRLPAEGARTIVAELPEVPFGRAIISRHGDAIYASVAAAGRGDFEIRRSGGGLLVKSVTDADRLDCSTEGDVSSDVAADDLSNEQSPPLPASEPGVRRKAVGGTVQDVIIFFNDQARVVQGGAPGVPTDDADIRAKILAAIESTNVAYADSNIALTLRALLVTPIDYVYPPTEDLQRALDELRSTTDGAIDGVHSARDSLSADIVSLWVANDVGGGKANLNLPSNISFKNAFNVIRVQNPVETFVHEIGHNHGVRHLRDGYASPPSSWAVDSFAHFFSGLSGDSYITVVASNGDKTRVGATSRILRFSAPELSFDGSPTGVTGDRNAAATVRATGPIIAAFRGENVDVSSPTLTLKTKRRVKTKRGRYPVRGVASDGFGVASVTYAASGQKGLRTARGTNRWKFKVRLKKRRTAVKVFATDAAGNRSRPAKLKIIRQR